MRDRNVRTPDIDVMSDVADDGVLVDRHEPFADCTIPEKKHV